VHDVVPNETLISADCSLICDGKGINKLRFLMPASWFSREAHLISAMTGDIRIGISGWTYKPWRGAFYSKGLRQADELRYASRALRTIEINGTFYSLQKPESFLRWHDETPDDFVFAVKAPRYITHIRRIRDVEVPVANFFASGLLRLGRKLGPVLWQFPASMKFDADLFEAFFAILPHDMKQAATLAKRHDEIVKGRTWLKAEANLPVRHAVEIRNDGFVDERFLRLLKTYKIALVCADTVKWPRLMDVTADFIYCRLHGSEELYASGYDGKAIGFWQKHVGAWAKGGEPANAERIGAPARREKNGRDVFVYFDNDMKVRAPHDAACLAKLFGFNGRGDPQ
jgi:uncharacterized protein YecE (DUF72 family)